MTLPTFSQTKLEQFVVSFYLPHTQDLQPTTSTAQTPIFSFCPLTEAEVSKIILSSHPTTWSSRPNPLAPSPRNPSHILTSTYTYYQHIFTHRHLPHCVQAGPGNPLLKKPTLNTSLIENYIPVSLLPFIAKTLERVVFNQVLLFLSQNNKLVAKQSGFSSGHFNWDYATLSHWRPANCKSQFQIISPNSAGSICCFWHC